MCVLKHKQNVFCADLLEFVCENSSELIGVCLQSTAVTSALVTACGTC